MSRDLYYGTSGSQIGVPAEIVIFRHSGGDRSRYLVSLQVPNSREQAYGTVWSAQDTFAYAVVDDFGDLVRVP